MKKVDKDDHPNLDKKDFDDCYKIKIEELAAAAFPTFELIYSLVTPPPELPDLGDTII